MNTIDQQSEALIERLLTGDRSARDKLIVINRPLVRTTVERLLNVWVSCRHLRDDLIGEGTLILVETIGKEIERLEAGGTRQPLQNYLITALRRRLIDELEKQASHYQVHQYVKAPEHALAAEDPIFTQIEDREFLSSLCESKREREILTLFLEGRNQVDISRETGYTENVVNKTFQQFREKLREAQENLSEARSV